MSTHVGKRKNKAHHNTYVQGGTSGLELPGLALRGLSPNPGGMSLSTSGIPMQVESSGRGDYNRAQNNRAKNSFQNKFSIMIRCKFKFQSVVCLLLGR